MDDFEKKKIVLRKNTFERVRGGGRLVSKTYIFIHVKKNLNNITMPANSSKGVDASAKNAFFYMLPLKQAMKSTRQ